MSLHALRQWHSKPAFWLMLVVLSAIFAWCALQQITFVPGVPIRGYAQTFLILFAITLVGFLVVWFLAILLWRLFCGRSHADT
jgi:hypothetical protein